MDRETPVLIYRQIRRELAEKDGLKSGILGTRSCSPVETLSDGATADAVYIVINAPHRDLLNQVEVDR